MTHPRLAPLISQFEGRALAFRDLPSHAQDALVYFFAVEQGLWDLDLSDAERARKEAIRKFGERRFGWVELPMGELAASVEEDEGFLQHGFQTFREYHDWYTLRPYGTERTFLGWPLILSGWEWETLSDGWDRLHAAASQGAEWVECLYFLD